MGTEFIALFLNGGIQMTEITSGQGMLMIALMCGVLLMIVLRGKRTEIMIGFVLRALCGLVCIYVVNYVMLHFQYQGTIGVNPYTLLASCCRLQPVLFLHPEKLHFLKKMCTEKFLYEIPSSQKILCLLIR